ncbi:hypothetical protein MY3296_008365 [Beauveria thailandica]
MQFSTSFVVLFCALGLQGAAGSPIVEGPGDVGSLDTEPQTDNTTELIRRNGDGNSAQDPIEAELFLDGTKKNMLPFEADCYAILCLDAPDVLQRVNDRVIKTNRRTSGVCASPFKRNKAKYKITLPPKDANWGDFISPEEYPFASSLQGGSKAFLFPVSLQSQNSQGGTLNGLLAKNNIKQFDPSSTSPGASDRTWYKIIYKGNLGPYCKALMNNDKTVCRKSFNGRGSWGFDVADYAYKYDKAGKKYNLLPRQ